MSNHYLCLDSDFNDNAWCDFNLYIRKLSSGRRCLMLPYARCATTDPDGRKRVPPIGQGITNFTNVAATFNGIIRSVLEGCFCACSCMTTIFSCFGVGYRDVVSVKARLGYVKSCWTSQVCSKGHDIAQINEFFLQIIDVI